jgi:pimeloyl-ACP methyl ester carboxylesterase
MKTLWLFLLLATASLADPVSNFVSSAREVHGSDGEKAALFLAEHMPGNDRAQLDQSFLMENLDLALKARDAFPWSAQVPEELFLNDVLPYAVLDETREAWRPRYFELAGAVVKDAASATEAVQLLNRDFFKRVNVHYSTERERPNQSPSESEAQGKASCTGLSIILVDACRAVGIPARIAGIPLWSNQRGNHAWVEFWDDGWHFVGSDEYDAEGVDRGWFVGQAAQAQEAMPQHAIYASSWKKTGTHFPLVWAPENDSVPAINVTARYAKPTAQKNTIGIRLHSKQGKRIAIEGALLSETGEPLATFKTRDESADLNDMQELEIVPGKRYRIRFRDHQTDLFTAEAGVATLDISTTDLKPRPDKLSKAEIPKLVRSTFDRQVELTRAERQQELDAREITLNGKSMKWLESTHGKAPRKGRSLWISMHGGGGAPAAVNSQQWENQARLYQPKEGIYLAPRAPTDTWNLWHEAHIDPLFDRLIENMVALRDVDPDKIYLMGYSAGGDGVWQLAPRMADRFAAAAMMAGHPNEASLLGLRNLPFAIFMGGNDAAYDRNKVAGEKAQQLAELHEQNPDGYIHLARIYEGLGHWMDERDQEALPWMAGFARNPWPRKIVWFQDDVTHDRFYWIKLPEGTATKDSLLEATVEGQKIRLDGDVPPGTRIRLSDALLDLDRPVEISVNGKPVFSGKTERRAEVVEATLAERLDPASAACAEIVLE